MSVWEDYVDGVLSGTVLACATIKQACQRHRDDLERSKSEDFPYEFNEKRAIRIIQFFSKLQLVKGLPWPGKPFIPEPWQQFCLVSLFGWIRKTDKLRRFRKGLITVPRKNGKSPTFAGIGLYGLIADNEMGAEIYSVATKLDQAKIIWDFANDFREYSGDMKSLVVSRQTGLFIKSTRSKFRALTSENKGLDGLNTHVGLIDEFQNHPNDNVHEKIRTSVSARRQPLVLITGTAGEYNEESPCWMEYSYAKQILSGNFVDLTYFAYIAEADKDDDWEDEKTWYKCNPNLGVSKYIDYMRSEAQAARNEPSKLNGFKRLDLNIWTQQREAAVNMIKWKACADRPQYKIEKPDKTVEIKIVNPNDFEAVIDGMLAQWRQPFAGGDLASKNDLTALALLFPPAVDDHCWWVACKYWVPEAGVKERAKDDRIPYDRWVSEGRIAATPGTVTDYNFVRTEVLRLHHKLHFKGLGMDPYNALMLMNTLKSDGVPVVEVRQGMKSLSDPTKEFFAWIESRKLRHLNDPVLNWMAGNLSLIKDPAGNIMPDKMRARARIDGISALVNAIYLAVSQLQSVYSSRGIVTI